MKKPKTSLMVLLRRGLMILAKYGKLLLKRWGHTMEYLLIILGIILDRLFNFGLGTIKGWAEKSLLAGLTIEKCNTPFSHDGVTYWSILLSVGKGNLLTRILCRGKTSLKLTGYVAFEAFETEPSIEGQTKAFLKGDIYEVNGGWGRKRMPFCIKRNSKIKLAVARRILSEQEGCYLYVIGGWAGTNIPLTDTYDLILNLQTDDRDEPINLRCNRIKEYIREGNPR